MDPLLPSSTPSRPVSLELQMPERFDRIQLLLRVLISIAFGMLHRSSASLFGALYFCLPVLAAVLISRRQGVGFLTQDAPWLTSLLEWVVGFYAYMLCVTDRFPLGAQERVVHLHVQTSGTPTVAGALGRLVRSVPHALVLMVLGVLSCLIWVVAALAILFTEHYPVSLHTYQRQLVGWMARLFAFHASLIASYPPFALADDPQWSAA